MPSRDGQWLAFVSRPSPYTGSGALPVQGGDGTSVWSIALPFNPVFVAPADIPGGQAWLVPTNGEGGSGLYRVGAESGTVETVLPIGAGVFNLYETPRKGPRVLGPQVSPCRGIMML